VVEVHLSAILAAFAVQLTFPITISSVVRFSARALLLRTFAEHFQSNPGFLYDCYQILFHSSVALEEFADAQRDGSDDIPPVILRDIVRSLEAVFESWKGKHELARHLDENQPCQPSQNYICKDYFHLPMRRTSVQFMF
jgi:hypothetical protein